MRVFLALLLSLLVSSAGAQDYFYSSSYSYSTPDYGFGYSTGTYGFSSFGGRSVPYYSSSWTTPDYGFGRVTSSYGYGGLPYVSPYSPTYSWGYRPLRSGFGSGFSSWPVIEP